MRQIVGALALPCPLEYFDVSPRLFEDYLNWYEIQNLKFQLITRIASIL